MNANVKKAYYYHAHANSLGGTLVQPVQRQVSTNASASLATAGGFHNARIEQFHVDGLVSAGVAHVRVSGSEHVHHLPGEDRKEKRSWRTLTAATVEGLNILEVLTADRIVAQISIDHPQDGGAATVSLLGSRFENLKVHGTLIEPVMDTHVFGAGRAVTESGVANNSPLQFAELIKLAKTQHLDRPKPHSSHKAATRFSHGDPQEDLDTKGTALCSLVKNVTVQAPAESFGHMLHIPDFGNVFLGELLVSRYSAQLTMLRVEMGCMAEGSISACSALTNGRTMP
jgi:hypothetical protein